MNSMSDSATPSQSRLISVEETDRLLKKVEQDIANKNFDRNNHELIQQMVDCLGDSRGLTRLGFAEALGAIGKPAVPFLTEAVAHHPNVVVQRAAAKTLTLIADPASVPVLLNSFLHDRDQVVRNSCIGALAVMGEVVVPSLIEILASDRVEESIKGHAAWALAFIGIKAQEQIYKASDSPSADLRSAVVGAVAKMAEEEPEKRAYELLIKSLKDTSVNVRSEAAAALGLLRYKPAIPQLIELINNSEIESRKSAALALMKIKDPSALDALQNAIDKESDTGVKQVIKLAIAKINQSEEDWD